MQSKIIFLTTSVLLLILTGCKKETEDPRSMIQPSFTYKEYVNGEVLFSGKSDNSISIEEYTWTFGDGEVWSGVSSAHTKTYKKNGTYDVKLEVKDRSGRRESVSNKVVVTQAPL